MRGFTRFLVALGMTNASFGFACPSNAQEAPGCAVGSGSAMSRYAAADQLQSCLQPGLELSDAMRRLPAELEPELMRLNGRLADLEAMRFSAATKLTGRTTFVLGGNAFSGSNTPLVKRARAKEGATTFNFDAHLNFDTSFTGDDLLHIQLRAGNFAASAFGNYAALNQLEVAYEELCGEGRDCSDVVAINRLFYRVPIGDHFTVTFGGKVRQDDMLAMWPSLYPADTILDYFTYTGAAGAYNTNLGAGAGLGWKNKGWSLSAQYIAYNGNVSIGTVEAVETSTIQLGYVGGEGAWGAAVAFNYSSGIPGGVYPGSATPLAALDTTVDPDLEEFGTNGGTSSLGLAAYWQPARSGWIPSISTGWGMNRVNPGFGVKGFDRLITQSWYVGLQWTDALEKGNSAGMAFGQPTFLTACGTSCAQLLGPGQSSPRDGLFAWEWWYSVHMSDSITITPALFYLSNLFGQLNRVLGEQAGISRPSLNNLGVLVKTTLRF